MQHKLVDDWHELSNDEKKFVLRVRDRKIKFSDNELFQKPTTLGFIDKGLSVTEQYRELERHLFGIEIDDHENDE